MDYYISNGLVFAYIVLFLCFNMKSKINKAAAFFAIFVPFAGFGLTQKILPIHPIIQVAVTWIIFGVLAWLVFEEPWKIKLFMILVDLVICYAVSNVSVVILLAFTKDVNTFSVPAAIVYHTLMLAVLAIFTIIRKKIVLSRFKLTAFIVIGIVQLLFAEIAVLFMVYGGDPTSPQVPSIELGTANGFAFIVIAVGGVLYIVSDIVLFIMMKKLSQSEKAEEEMRFREYKNQMNLDYYKSVEKSAEETRKLRHDMANIIQIAGSLIEGNEKDKETSEQLLTQIRKEFSEIHLEKYTENSLVNAIVSNKAAVCRENGIACDFNITIPEKLSVDEIDICKAYVNIIDNAINAVMPLEDGERKIEIKSYIEDGNLLINSKNYCSDTGKKENKASSEHGYGQKILRDIADKYNGKFLTEQNEKTYVAMLCVKM